MDLNQLYFEHQTQHMKAERAISPELRQAHRLAASQIAGRIGHMQHLMGAAAAAGWTALAARRAVAEKASRQPPMPPTAAPGRVDRNAL